MVLLYCCIVVLMVVVCCVVCWLLFAVRCLLCAFNRSLLVVSC